MANRKDLNSKVFMLRNMQKVMRAMSMISTIKLRKLFRLQASLVFFDQSVERLIADVRQALKDPSHPLMSGEKPITKSHVVIFTADKGLCGPHNSSVTAVLDQFIDSRKRMNIAVEVSCIGSRGTTYCKNNGYEIFFQSEIHERFAHAAAIKSLASNILQRFLGGEVQEVFLIGNVFRSTLEQDAVIDQLIPLARSDEKAPKRPSLDALTEPEPGKFLVLAAGLYLYYKLMSALYNSYLSENSARMTAMENATNNSQNLINQYVRLQNRARQAAITSELIEIVSGKEALKG